MDLALRPSIEKLWNGTPRAYQVVQDGLIIGLLQKEYRPKNCGGPAFAFKQRREGRDVIRYFPNLERAKREIRQILSK